MRSHPCGLRASITLFDDPLHTLLEPNSSFGGGWLDLPVSTFYLHQFHCPGYFLCRHCAHKILLVSEHEDGDPTKGILVQQLVQLFSSLTQSVRVGTVDDINQCVGVLKVVLPVWADGFLPPDVPYIQLEALVQQALDIESLCRHDVVYVLVRKFLQDRSLARVVESQHEDADLFL